MHLFGAGGTAGAAGGRRLGADRADGCADRTIYDPHGENAVPPGLHVALFASLGPSTVALALARASVRPFCPSDHQRTHSQCRGASVRQVGALCFLVVVGRHAAACAPPFFPQPRSASRRPRPSLSPPSSPPSPSSPPPPSLSLLRLSPLAVGLPRRGGLRSFPHPPPLRGAAVKWGVWHCGGEGRERRS